MKSEKEIEKIANKMLDYYEEFLGRPRSELPLIEEFSNYLQEYYAIQADQTEAIRLGKELEIDPNNLVLGQQSETADSDLWARKEKFSSPDAYMRERIAGGTGLSGETYDMLQDMAMSAAESPAGELRAEFGIKAYLKEKTNCKTVKELVGRNLELSGIVNQIAFYVNELPPAEVFEPYLLAANNSRDRCPERAQDIRDAIQKRTWANPAVPKDTETFDALLNECADTVLANKRQEIQARKETPLQPRVTALCAFLNSDHFTEQQRQEIHAAMEYLLGENLESVFSKDNPNVDALVTLLNKQYPDAQDKLAAFLQEVREAGLPESNPLHKRAVSAKTQRFGEMKGFGCPN